jgi:hypothetical protein
MPDRADYRRLILQIERALLARAHVTVLLTAANATVADRRRELRNLKARMSRTRGRSPMPGRIT